MPALGEFDLIRRFFTPASLPAHVTLGVGDDCALLAVPAGHELALSIDTHVAGVHFPLDAPPADLAARALHCAASDLCAMGAMPLGFTLALTLPAADPAWLQAFSQGLFAAADALGCPLLGGDTTRGPLTITVQVQGCVPAGQALRRAGARAGDQVWVSGTLGDGAAALAMLGNTLQVDAPARDYLLQRFYHPAIDFMFAQRLRGHASSCIDVSDGLLADLGHVCTASGVGALIRLAQLPLAAEWRDAVPAVQAQQWALAGGDDYRLCFTAAPAQAALLQALPGVACVGDVVAGCGVTVLDENGVTFPVTDTSFRHF